MSFLPGLSNSQGRTVYREGNKGRLFVEKKLACFEDGSKDKLDSVRGRRYAGKAHLLAIACKTLLPAKGKFRESTERPRGFTEEEINGDIRRLEWLGSLKS